jgi:hypothetical protein
MCTTAVSTTPVAKNGTLSDCWLEEKNYLYVGSTTERCFKKIKKYLIEDFLICEYLREFSKKFANGPNGILWGWGETDS